MNAPKPMHSHPLGFGKCLFPNAALVRENIDGCPHYDLADLWRGTGNCALLMCCASCRYWDCMPNYVPDTKIGAVTLYGKLVAIIEDERRR